MITNTIIIIPSPLEQFEIVSLFSFNAPILGYLNLTITNLAFYSIVVLFLVVSLHIIANNNSRLVPSKWSIALESSYQSISSMVRDQIGHLNELYLPLIYALFFFILISNLTGNVPYSYTITTSIIVTLSLSFTFLFVVTILGLYIHKVKFFSYFIPSGTPLALVPLLVLIELLSYSARAFSLGIRLFANMTAGHTLLKILSTFLLQMFSAGIIIAILTIIPFAIFMALIGLELAVSFIQSYVFCILTCSYIRDAIELH